MMVEGENKYSILFSIFLYEVRIKALLTTATTTCLSLSIISFVVLTRV
jgi:hypothetical protein